MRALCSLLLVLVACLGAAQTVRPMESSSSAFREVRSLAKKEKLDWPNVTDGESGSFLIFTADKNNADLTVISTLEKDDTLKELKAAAIAVGLPKTDFLVRSGSTTSTVDMEFNDTIVKTKTSGSFTFPLKRLISEIESRNFPKPIVVAFTGGLESAKLRSAGETRDLNKEWTLMSQEEAEKWEFFDVKDSMTSWAPIAGWGLLIFFSGLILGSYGSTVFVFLGLIKGKRKQEEPEAVPSPQEVQDAYDKAASRPWWKKILPVLPMIVIVGPLLLGDLLGFNIDGFFTQALYGFPFPKLLDMLSIKTILILAFPLVALMPLGHLIAARKAKKDAVDKVKTPQEEQMESLNRSLMPMIYVLMGAFAIFLPIILFPEITRWIPLEYRRVLPLGIAAIGIGFTTFFMIRTTLQDKSKELPNDDFVTQEAMRLGQLAGVKVTKVKVRESVSANAWATFFGTVGVTSKLKEEFSQDETRAILAHEVGHLKGMDVPRLFWTNLIMVLAFIGLVYWVGTIDNNIGRIVKTLSFMINVFVLPVILGFLMAPARHKAELAADRFAVEVTGDLDLVARTLIKIHDINHSPHRLTAWDERMSSHPALTTRLKKLYEAQGLTPPETNFISKEPSTD